jgi:hypothetical protein
MPDVTSFVARSFQERGGWSKIGVAVSVLIVVAAGVTLVHVLRDIDLGKVATAVRATPLRAVLLASFFVAISYVTLTFYDYFSLRTIGCAHVPYRVAALASFTSYSIGHNIGATVFTAGAVRWRIYSTWNLSLVDVAKMAFVTGLTFWLGNVVVLGVGVLLAPEVVSSVNRLPDWVNQALAASALAFIACYLIWLAHGPRAIGRGGWTIVLPSAPLTLVQIGIGLLDLGSGALAMIMLLPVSPEVDVMSLVVTYVASTLVGFLSHAPGSIGVFEAGMLIALPQFWKEELLASLLIFRCLYFVLPLLLAVLLMAVRELWLAGSR